MRIPTPRSCSGILLLLVLMFAGSAAAADLVSATADYLKKDYAKAFSGFRALAEIGQPTAQFDLAIMYRNGEGTRPSDIYAYAWASLAAENGLEKAKVLADELRPGLAPGSERIAADIEAQFGNAVLDARLNPRIVDGIGNRSACRRLRSYIPPYPPDALVKGVEGAAYAEFTVMPDGHTRIPRIIYAVPTGFFEAATRYSLLHTKFVPPADGKPEQCTIFFQFLLEGVTGPSQELEVFVNQTLTHARAGDPNAQMLYGMLLVGLPQLNKPRSQALPWFLKSAQAGTPAAQYQVGYSLLKGWGCDCEENKGLDWLRRAAQSGQPDAEVTLAMYALRGHPDEERLRQAKLWLEQAAASDNHDGKLYLAALLAASPDPASRDSKRALTLLDDVFRGVRDDPIAFEIRAAAQASAGQYAEAVTSESKAVAMAKNLFWEIAPLNERLSSYSAKQPWYGELLDF